jgi:hypothetical protein
MTIFSVPEEKYEDVNEKLLKDLWLYDLTLRNYQYKFPPQFLYWAITPSTKVTGWRTRHRKSRTRIISWKRCGILSIGISSIKVLVGPVRLALYEIPRSAFGFPQNKTRRWYRLELSALGIRVSLLQCPAKGNQLAWRFRNTNPEIVSTKSCIAGVVLQEFGNT